MPSAGSTVTIAHAVTLAAPLTNTGTVTINSGASFAVAAQYTNNGTTTNNGTFQINTGGSVAGTGLIFGSNSLLKYNVNANYGRSNEWTASSGTVGTTPGYPFSVQLSNNSTLNFPNGSSTTRAMAGDLTIDNGSALYQDFGGGSAALIVGGSAVLNGNLSLGSASGGDLTVGGNWTRAATGAAFNNNGRRVTFNGSGTQTIAAGGGSESFAFLTAGGSGTLTLSSATPTSVTVTGAGGLTLSSTHASSTIDLNGQQLTLSGGGNLSLSTGARFITGASGSAFNVTTSTVTVTSGGTLLFGDNVAVVLSVGFDPGSGLTTIGGNNSGSLQINSGGFISTNGPKYATGSTLLYNTGTTYGRGTEWTASTGTAGTTAGYPSNVRLSNNTTLNYPNGSSVTAKAMGGNLTIDAGSSLYMDFGGPATVGSLTVGGSLSLSGNLSLGNVIGGDMILGGSWVRNSGSNFTHNSRSVTFNGSAAQTITGSAATSFAFLTINNTSGTGAAVGVILGQPVTVTSQLTLTAGVVNSTANLLTVSATGTTAISGGSGTAFVGGALARALPASLVSGSTYVFPVGKAGSPAVYVPYELVNPTTSGGSPVVQVEALNANSGGSSPTLTLNNNRYWATSITANSGNFTDTSIRVTDAGIGTANVLANSATAAGTNYVSIGGTVATNTITSSTVTNAAYLGFVVMANSSPAIQATPSTLSGFTYIVGFGPSASQSYNLSGNNLTPAAGNLTVTGSTNYEVSTDNATFGSSVNVGYTGAILTSTPIYVRLKSGLAAANYNGELIVNSGGGAVSVNVSASGSVTTPTITTTGTLLAFSTDEGTPSASQSFTASGTSLTADLVVTAPPGFEVSLTSGGTYSSSLNLTPTANTVASTSIFVRIAAATLAGTYSGNVTLTSTGATSKTVAIPSSTVRPLAPTLQASAASVTGTASNAATVSWTRGNGANVIVLMKSGSAVDANPVNGTAYSANASFGSGTQIGTGNRVVYIGTGTSVPVTNLTAGTTYHVAVYEFNGTGSNLTYNTTSPAIANGPTLTIIPTTPTFSAVTAVGFTVNWGTVTGASSYRLDVATDNGFTSFVSGYNDLPVATNSQSVSGLSPNTQYFARVRALNSAGQSSGNTTPASQTTNGLTAPVATASTLNTTSSFRANWNAVTGATDYRVDVYRKTAVTTTDLIISEYLEGSSNNKYVEIYNGTGASINLANYELRLYTNGSPTVSTATTLSGTILAGQSIVYRNSASTIYGGTTTTLAAVNYNGNDAIALFKTSTSSFVDIFGRIGEDPGAAGWTATGGFATADKTLRRKSTVSSGVTSNPTSGFPTLATEWDVFNIDDVSGLGAHTALVYDRTDVSSSGATSLTVTGLAPSTSYFYVVRATSTNSTSANSNEISAFTIAVPIIFTVASPPLQTFTTTYGTASTVQDLFVSGSQMVADMVVTAPAGYEIALASGGAYATTLNITPSGGSVGEAIHARLAATAAAGSPAGNFSASTTGASTINIAATGTVAPKNLTVTGVTADNKTYDGTTAATLSGTPLPVGVVNGDIVSIGGTPVATFATANAGTGITVTVTGYTLVQPASNYTLTQPTLSANINKATPTATLVVTNSPVTYNGSPQAATVGVFTSSVPGAAANILTGGAATQTNAGTYAVSADFVPTDSANYNTLTGLSAGNFTINKADVVLSVSNTPQTYDASPKSATVIATPSGHGTVSNISTGGAPTQTNAGTYAVTADFTSTDPNYNSLSGASAGNFVIDKTNVLIVFNPLPNKRTGDAPFSVAVNLFRASDGQPASGLSVSLSSSDTGVATTSGAQVTIVAAGTTDLTASSPGDSNHNAAVAAFAGSDTQTLNVVDAAGVLLAWEFNGLSNSGSSPFASAVTATNLSSGGLTRGSGVSSGTDANGWGGTGFASASATAAASNGQFVTFTVQASSGYQVSLQKIQPYLVKRQTAGAPTDGRWQYSLDGTNFTDLTSDINWGGSNGVGVRQASIDLTGVAALQNVASTTTITFRVLNWNGSNGTFDTWTFQDHPPASGLDLVVSGSVTSAGSPTLSLTGSPTGFTTTFGTASGAQSFPVSGSFLTGNAVATAPTGYEVSVDGSSYGPTATYTPSSGSFSGNVFVRIAANARPSVPLGPFLDLSSAGATTQSLLLSGTVDRKMLSIAVTGTNSFVFNGTPQGPAGTNVTGAVPGFPPTGSVGIDYIGGGFGPFPFPPTDAGNYTAFANIASDPDYVGATSSPFSFLIDRAPTSIAVTGGTTFTYNASPQGPTTWQATGVPGYPPTGTVTLTYIGGGYGPSPVPPRDAGSYQAFADLASDQNYYGSSSLAFAFVIGQANLTVTADSGQFKNKGAAEPGTLTYSTSGLQGSDSTFGFLQRAFGETPGVYAINQGSVSGGPNYNLTYVGANFAVAGPLGTADSATKPTDSTAIKIPISTLLGNDSRVTPAGATVTSSLSLTSVTPGSGNGVSIGGAFVFFTPNPSTSSETFTYTLTDTTNNTTDTVTVTVNTAAPSSTPFTLNLVYQGTATFDGANTTKEVDFIAVPGQSIIVEYSTDLLNWTPANGGAPMSTGTTGSFFTILSAPGNQTSTWNAAMYFRGRY